MSKGESRTATSSLTPQDALENEGDGVIAQHAMFAGDDLDQQIAPLDAAGVIDALQFTLLPQPRERVAGGRFV